MTRHSFDPDVAMLVGTDAATIYQNLLWWVEKNAANGRHFHEGKWWTYNSVKAFELLFPYLTGRQIRRCLDKLEEQDLIGSGNFNASAYDRTKWYCVLRQPDLTKMANGLAQKVEPIPDDKPVPKPDKKPKPATAAVTCDSALDFFEEIEPPGLRLVASNPPKPTDKQLERCFDEHFWPLYPNRQCKLAAKAKFVTQAREHTAKAIIGGLRQSVRAWQEAGTETQFIPLPTTWLNQGRWMDEHQAAKPLQSNARQQSGYGAY